MSRFATDAGDVVPVEELQPYPGNARTGDVEAIAESLEANGQYVPIVVSRATGTILKGNHTWLAARKLGWEDIRVAYVDVDDEEAARIVLADNRTSDLAEYDDVALLDLLEDLPSLEGTGYEEDAAEHLRKMLEDDGLLDVLDPADLLDEDETLGGALPESDPRVRSTGAASGDDADDESEMDDESGADEGRFDDIPDQAGVKKLNPDVFFVSSQPWNIPELLPEHIADVPEPVDTWAGQRYTPDDGESHYVYVYNADSPKGLPYERAILAFYTFDHYFEQWWRHPDYYTQKALNAGIPRAVEPDYSIFHGDPRAVQLFNLYRRRWTGRFFQEAGLKVIPHVTWPDRKAIEEFALWGIPEEPQSISIQFHRGDDSDEETEEGLEELDLVLSLLKPKQVLVYGGPQVHEAIGGNLFSHQPEFTYAVNRVAKHRKRFTARDKLRQKGA